MLSRSRLLPVAVLGAIGLAIAVYFLQHRLAYPFDDTFITFRYAKNLAHGFGIVWNPGGTATEGYTNFLLVLLLAVAQLLHLDLLLTSQWIGVMSAIALSVIGFAIAARLAGRTAAWAAGLLLLIDPFMWFNAMSGMETNLFVMLVLATWAAYMRSGIRGAYVLAVLATLTRPEGAVLAAILFALDWRSVGFARAFKSALTFAGPIALYAAWKLWYFGDVLPNSFYVKVVQAREGSTAPRLPGLGAVKLFYLQNTLLVLVALVGVFYASRKKAGSAYAFGWIWIIAMSMFYSASYLLMGKYDRFTLSIEAIILVFVATGACYLLSILRWKWLVWVAVILAFRYTELWRGSRAILADVTDHNAPYEQLGEAIARLPDHEHITIASADAGVLPFYSNARHFDLVGLNTNEVARGRSAEQVIALTAKARPDVLLIPVRMSGADSCFTIYREGHGLIGAHYPELVADPGFTSYRSIGRLDIGYYQMDLVADTSSKFYGALQRATKPIVSEPTRCYR